MNTQVTNIPQAMEPRGTTGRLFGLLMEWLNNPAYIRAAKLLNPNEGESFLEIGFGTGKLLEVMANRLNKGCVAGIDPSRLMVETARRRLHKTPISSDIRQGTAETLPWRNATFDTVAALHSFQFWPDPVQALGEIHRVLKPGGKCVLILRNHDSRRNRSWLPNPWSRTDDETGSAQQLLSAAGFQVHRDLPDVGRSPVLVGHKPA